MNEKKCLVPECKRNAYARGLCNTHYVTARKLIKMGKTNWEKLEKNGKAVHPVGRTRSFDPVTYNWFMEEK